MSAPSCSRCVDGLGTSVAPLPPAATQWAARSQLSPTQHALPLAPHATPSPQFPEFQAWLRHGYVGSEDPARPMVEWRACVWEADGALAAAQGLRARLHNSHGGAGWDEEEDEDEDEDDGYYDDEEYEDDEYGDGAIGLDWL